MPKIVNNAVDATAVAYQLTYTCLMERDKEVRTFYSDQVSIYIFPAIINAAFSCEVALKNLINSCRKNIWTRRLPFIMRSPCAEMVICPQSSFRYV